MQFYVTFGQVHRHSIGDVVFDRDSVATYEAEDYDQGRKIAFALFGPKFCFFYEDEAPDMSFFPRGLVQVPTIVLENIE